MTYWTAAPVCWARNWDGDPCPGSPPNCSPAGEGERAGAVLPLTALSRLHNHSVSPAPQTRDETHFSHVLKVIVARDCMRQALSAWAWTRWVPATTNATYSAPWPDFQPWPSSCHFWFSISIHNLLLRPVCWPSRGFCFVWRTVWRNTCQDKMHASRESLATIAVLAFLNVPRPAWLKNTLTGVNALAVVT